MPNFTPPLKGTEEEKAIKNCAKKDLSDSSSGEKRGAKASLDTARNSKESEEGCAKAIADGKKTIISLLSTEYTRVHHEYNDTLSMMKKITNGGIMKQLKVSPDTPNATYQGLMSPDPTTAPPSVFELLNDTLNRAIELTGMCLEELWEKAQKMAEEESGASKADAAVQSLCKVELNNIKKARTALEDECKNFEKERYAERIKIRDLEAEICTIKDQEWYATIQCTGTRDGGAGNETSPTLDPAKGYSKKTRLQVCNNIIAESEKKIIKTLRDQFTDIFHEFEMLTRISWATSKGKMAQLLVGHRDMSVSIPLSARFQNMPKEIAENKRGEVIDALSRCVKELLLDLKDLQDVYSKYREECLRTGNTGGMPPATFKHGIEMMKSIVKGKDQDFKRFDMIIAGERSTIKRFKDQIAQVEKKEWDVQNQEEMLQQSVEDHEKLVLEMMALERKRCEEIKCPCIEKERAGNRIAPGLGTTMRNTADRKKVEEILASGEPWKEEHEQDKKCKDEISRNRMRKEEDLNDLVDEGLD